LVLNTNISIAVRCGICGELEIKHISLFELLKNKKTNLRCTCGQTKAIIETRNLKSMTIEIACFACQDNHIYNYSLKQLLRGDKVIKCTNTGMEICFVGNNESINDLIKHCESDTFELIAEKNLLCYFENIEIMKKSLEKIKSLESKGKIKCDCGSHDIYTDLFPDRIELKCMNCNSIKMIYAENEDDYSYLNNKKKILMHKHRFECIDAINQNNE